MDEAPEIGASSILLLNTVEELIKNGDKHTIKELVDVMRIWNETSYELDKEERIKRGEYEEKYEAGYKEDSFLWNFAHEITDFISSKLTVFILFNRIDLMTEVDSWMGGQFDEPMDNSDEFRIRLEAYKAGVPAEDIIA